ncbi:transcriptional regulator, TetR family [Jatrophihabitans endophyticus]|uniref:Transcriptional regulator, TetR family n=1 Tax=Jatrophihabitans endophyticus TaxID=1206085 RepID=A0A1M5M2C6_9ACTN|nr:TetR family transcriptional regulator [Jatrophihabitans endophyticus]SHG71386.1 transcriptional regulator, TetR family [Jatrophihabitans endophyticus]
MSSPRRAELVEAAYVHVLRAGLADLSLRPVAEAIGSSTGVLRFLFGSRDGLVRALLDRARADDAAVLARLDPQPGLGNAAAQLWLWLAAPQHRQRLVLWAECYATSLRRPEGAFADYARGSAADWLAALARAQPPGRRDSAAGRAERTAALALLRGCLLDLLGTGDLPRTSRAVRDGLTALATART